MHTTDYKKRKALNAQIQTNKDVAYTNILSRCPSDKAKGAFKRPAFSIGKAEKEN